MTSARCTCRCSMWRWPTGTASHRACASSPRRAARRWRWSTTAISTRAITSWSRHIKLGNINETHMIELVASDQQLKFGRDKFDTLPQYCLDCDVRFACHGGCPKDRFISTPDGQPGLNYLCAGYKAVLPSHRSTHAVDGAPAAAESRAVRTDAPVCRPRIRSGRTLLAKTGRNDPCPCGSGQKFKNCHGRESLTPML